MKKVAWLNALFFFTWIAHIQASDFITEGDN